jgi:LysM repeat protein
MRLILLSALLLTNLVAQNVTIYHGETVATTNEPSAAAPEAPGTPTSPPPTASAPPAANAAPATPADAGPPADATAAAALPGETEYTVVQGDSLWRISRKHKVTVDAIKTLNQLPNDRLKIGQILRIPPPPEPKAKPVSAKDKKNGPDQHNGVAVAKPAAPVASPPPPPPTLQERFTAEIKQIASNKIAYNRSWTPPGEQESWVMDCSNTTRWLYKKVLGVEIDRTASDQYDHLMKEGRAWLTPRIDDKPDLDFLDKNLQTGDLLFWENTYKPDREPPITHVMLYLGKDEQGRMLMAGSSSGAAHGMYNPAGSGPDVYVFDPLSPSGGYNTGLFGWTRVNGRFAAYGRPIDNPDAAKPADAAAIPPAAKIPTTVKAPN